MRRLFKPLLGALTFGFLLLTLTPSGHAAGFSVLKQFPIPNGEVQSVVVDAPHNVVYIAGTFTAVGSTPRNYLAALNATTGAVLPWNPEVDGIVHQLLLSGGYLYVVGDFTQLNGTARKSVGSFVAITELNGANTFLSPFDPNPSDDAVSCLASDGTNIYAGGFFSGIGGQATYAYLAKLDPLSGAAVAGWNPAPDKLVSHLAVSGTTLYVSGFFTNIGGQARAGLTSLDTSTALVSAWNPSPDNTFHTATVSLLQVEGSRVYVSGPFDTIAGVSRGKFVAFKTIDNSLDAAFDPEADNSVLGLSVDGGILYVGGSFQAIGGENRSALAALDASTGFATGWNPGATGTINTLGVRAGVVFVGAYNTGTIGGVTPTPGPYNFAAVTENAIIPPNHPPVVKINGKKKITTKKSTAVIRGTTTDPEGAADISSVAGRVGKKTYRPTGTNSWSFKAKLKRGTNKVSVTAQDSRGAVSKAATITIIRK